jgi:hypothetical protein
LQGLEDPSLSRPLQREPTLVLHIYGPPQTVAEVQGPGVVKYTDPVGGGGRLRRHHQQTKVEQHTVGENVNSCSLGEFSKKKIEIFFTFPA